MFAAKQKEADEAAQALLAELAAVEALGNDQKRDKKDRKYDRRHDSRRDRKQ